MCLLYIVIIVNLYWEYCNSCCDNRPWGFYGLAIIIQFNKLVVKPSDKCNWKSTIYNIAFY